MSSVVKKTISIKEIDPVLLLGYNDSHLRMIEDSFPALIIVRGDTVSVEGEEDVVEKIENVFSELVFLLHRNKRLDKDDLSMVLNMVQASPGQSSAREELDSVVLFTPKGYVKPKTEAQKKYIQVIGRNDIVIVIGPAGTGKTYLAVAAALSSMKEKQVKKIILARPAVEAGESLGFLPGDLKEKVDPYFRPLYDALSEMLPSEKLRSYLERQVIEVVPLAYMRGRTLNDAFLILDEAQNTTSLQMKMFLTRLGVNSRAIITGDITQIDLASSVQSGLIQIQEILKGIDGIEFLYMDKKDVIRHKLVRDIIEAYDGYQNNKNSN